MAKDVSVRLHDELGNEPVMGQSLYNREIWQYTQTCIYIYILCFYSDG